MAGLQKDQRSIIHGGWPLQEFLVGLGCDPREAIRIVSVAENYGHRAE